MYVDWFSDAYLKRFFSFILAAVSLIIYNILRIQTTEALHDFRIIKVWEMRQTTATYSHIEKVPVDSLIEWVFLLMYTKYYFCFYPEITATAMTDCGCVDCIQLLCFWADKYQTRLRSYNVSGPSYLSNSVRQREWVEHQGCCYVSQWDSKVRLNVTV